MRTVLMADVSGGRARGRPRLGWIDGVKITLGSRVMTVEAARKVQKSEFNAAMFAWPCLVSDLSPTLW